MMITFTRSVAIAACIAMLAAAAFFMRLAAGQKQSADESAAITRRPADRQLLSRIAETAHDRNERTAEPLWRASAVALRAIAPEWRKGKIRVVRAGLFQWPQLSPEGRRLLLEESKFLLSHPSSFEDLALPIYRLTGNIEFILSNAPATPEAYLLSRRLTVSARRFDDYRRLREKESIEFRRILERLLREKASGDTILQTLLSIAPRSATKEIVDTYLRVLESNAPTSASGRHAELDQLFRWMRRGGSSRFGPIAHVASHDTAIPAPLRARILFAAGEHADAGRIETDASATRSVEWSEFHLDAAEHALASGDLPAARGHLAELPIAERDSIRALRLRESLAIAANDREQAAALAAERRQNNAPSSSGVRWIGLCSGNTFCGDRIVSHISIDSAAGIELTVASESPDSTPAYVEVLSNGEVLTEATVEKATTFVAPLKPGDHELEVRVVNPRTGTGARRQVTLL